MSAQPRARVLGTVLLLLATLSLSRLTAYRRFESLQKPLDSISREIAGFTSIETDDTVLSDAVLAELRPTSYLMRRYTKSGVNADLFIAFYGQQRAGVSMHSPKHCLPGAGWEVWDHRRIDMAALQQRVEINRYAIGREGQRLLVLYWYQSKSRILASEYVGKILLARDALFHNSTAASIVRVTVVDQPGRTDDAKQFAAAVIPEMQRCFGTER